MSNRKNTLKDLRREKQLRLGQRLRSARLKKGLTLKAVAERANCSESFLSKVEHGRAQPSLSRLYPIVESIGVTFSDLFEEDRSSDGIVQRKGDRPVLSFGRKGRNTGSVVEALAPLGGAHSLEGYLITLPPHAHGAGTVQHQGEELGFVIEGEIELSVDGRSFRLREGDSFCFRSELPHIYRNPGKRIARIIWVNTPPTF